MNGEKLTSSILSLVTTDMTQKEENHVMAKKHGLLAIIPVRNKDVPIHRTKEENEKG